MNTEKSQRISYPAFSKLVYTLKKITDDIELREEKASEIGIGVDFLDNYIDVLYDTILSLFEIPEDNTTEKALDDSETDSDKAAHDLFCRTYWDDLIYDLLEDLTENNMLKTYNELINWENKVWDEE